MRGSREAGSGGKWSRMFWFDKNAPGVLFCDCRTETDVPVHPGRTVTVVPDVRLDVRCMPFTDGAFQHVVFDPPHLLHAGDGWQTKKYGRLPHEWREFIRDASAECWRVLAPGGTMVFKWSEHDIKVSDVLACIECARPLYGSRTGKTGHWLVFVKTVDS